LILATRPPCGSQSAIDCGNLRHWVRLKSKHQNAMMYLLKPIFLFFSLLFCHFSIIGQVYLSEVVSKNKISLGQTAPLT